MKLSTCSVCGVQFRVKSGGHCPGGKWGGCCRTFAGQEEADKHRKGPYDPEGLRHCVDFSTDVTRGGLKVNWRLNRYGEWTTTQPQTKK